MPHRRVPPAHARIAALVAAMLLSGAAWAACPEGAGPAETTRIAYDALDPGLVRAGPLSFGPEAGDLLAWLRAPEDERRARAALHELARRYDLRLDRDDRTEPVLPDGWEEQARDAITAIGLTIVDANDLVVAVGAYWSTPVFERIRLVRVTQSVRASGPSDAAQHLASWVSTCAVEVTEWIEVPEELARELVHASTDTWMLAFGSRDGVGSEAWSTWIPTDRIGDALRFDHPGIPRDLEGYSATFYGPGPGLRWTLLNARRVSTTLGVGDLMSWLRELFVR